MAARKDEQTGWKCTGLHVALIKRKQLGSIPTQPTKAGLLMSKEHEFIIDLSPQAIEKWEEECLNGNFYSLFGRTHPDKDPYEMCQYCKNEDTQQIVNRGELAPYIEYYGTTKFKVFSCFCCSAVWHFPVTKKET